MMCIDLVGGCGISTNDSQLAMHKRRVVADRLTRRVEQASQWRKKASCTENHSSRTGESFGPE
jgi:hypothetical protein